MGHIARAALEGVTFQTDVLEKEVIRLQASETTALGAACLVGQAVGSWSD